MIFDDSYEEMEVLQPNQNLSNKLNAQTSLDNYIEKRQNQLVLQNLENVYTLYKLQINKDFFALPGDKENSHSNKLQQLSTQEESCLKLSLDKKTSGKSIDEFQVNEFNKENILSIKDINSQRGNTSIVCSQILDIDQIQRKSKTFSQFMRDISVQDLGQNKHKSLTNVELNLKLRDEQKIFEDLGSQNSLNSFAPQIQDMKKQKIENQKCLICTGNYLINDLVAKTSSCGHFFHQKCFENWVGKIQYMKDLRCPDCKSYLQ